MHKPSSLLTVDSWLETLDVLRIASFELLDDILSSLPASPAQESPKPDQDLIIFDSRNTISTPSSPSDTSQGGDRVSSNIATSLAQLLRRIHNVTSWMDEQPSLRLGAENVDRAMNVGNAIGAPTRQMGLPAEGMPRVASGPSLSLSPPYEEDPSSSSIRHSASASTIDRLHLQHNTTNKRHSLLAEDRRAAKELVLVSIVDELISMGLPVPLVKAERDATCIAEDESPSILVSKIANIPNMLGRQPVANDDEGLLVEATTSEATTPAVLVHAAEEDNGHIGTTLQDDALPIYKDLFPSTSPIEALSRIQALDKKPNPGVRRTKSCRVSSEYDQDGHLLLSAINRLAEPSPVMNSQRVELTAAKRRTFTALTTESQICRLSRGRFEEQRAQTRQMTADSLGELIERANSVGNMSDQRVMVDGRVRANLEVAKLQGHLEKMSKGRFVNQEWVSPAQQLQHELERLTDHYSKSITRSPYAHQRYYVSLKKQKDLFMHQVNKRMDRLRRIPGQDASFSVKG